MHRRRNGWVAAGFLLASLSLAGCAPTEAAATKGAGPATVTPIAGSDRSQVVLTAEAVKRVGITTELVSTTAAGLAQQSVIPLDAVLWDKDGRTWTYTNPAPLTYVPVELVIGRVEGDTAIMLSGPAPGTPVVTVGGAELLGAEFGNG